jgi:hypothetical protein
MSNMAAEWIGFVGRDMAPNAPMVQVMEMRKAFYAGLASGVKLGLERTPAQNLAEMNEYIADEDSRRRLARIEHLMLGDPDPNSVSGRELNTLVDQQMEAEKHLQLLCEDCPPIGYPTDKTRCDPCPRSQSETGAEHG